MIVEAIEIGHKAFPVYTTLRDLIIVGISAIVLGGMVYAKYRFVGILVAAGVMLAGLILTQFLRKRFGNAWPWEVRVRFLMRFLGSPDERGYISGGRRCHAAGLALGSPTFLVGHEPAMQAIKHRGTVLSPYGKCRPNTQSVSSIMRTSEIKVAQSHG